MSIGTLPFDEPPDIQHDTEAGMLRLLASILRSGRFDADTVETLAAAASEDNVDQAARCFAGHSLRWLAQQSAMMTTPIWGTNGDARR